MNTLKETILHIDDDASNRYIVKKMLEREGFTILEAHNGAEGLKQSLLLPDLIILDINLPDMTGFDVCKLIKKNHLTTSIPLLQTSASYVTTENRIEGLDSGADGYLTQPLESPVLSATVRSLLRTKSAERKAIKATQARDEMLAIVSHDLRTPLSFLILQSKLLSRQISEGNIEPDQQAKRLDKMTEACHRMNRLITDLMDITQIDEGKFPLNIQTMKSQNLVEDVLIAFSELVKHANLTFKLNDFEKEVSFDGDKDRLMQMLGNLITNAIKFTDPGGLITLSFSFSDNHLIIELEDTGKGIAPENQKKVFNRFWQERYERRESIGLGLSIVKGIVDAHGGDIDFHSEVGKGTRFLIKIPLTQTV